jgi:hypothetical protein
LEDGFELFDKARIETLSDDAMALFKRLVFLHVREPMLSQASRDAYRERRGVVSALAFDEVFSGSNAIK